MDKGFVQVMGGTPNPRIFTDVIRVQKIDAYGKVPLSFNLKKIIEELEEPQSVTILSIAAPRLPKKKLKEQLDIKTAKDLFNTVQAGFKLFRMLLWVKQSSFIPVNLAVVFLIMIGSWCFYYKC